MLSAENLLEKIPVLAISGDDLAVDSILYETLSVLLKGVDADIGQINLLPRGGRVEKSCIIKDGAPWPMGVDMHLLPLQRIHGFGNGYRSKHSGEGYLGRRCQRGC